MNKHTPTPMQATGIPGNTHKGNPTQKYVCPECGAVRVAMLNYLWMCNGSKRWARNTPPEMVDWRRVG